MLSKIKKISKDMLIYSALASEFEPLDFKNDALAGVRANYFNAHNHTQTEKTELTVDNKPLSLSYSMKNGEPLSWKALLNNQPYQTVKRERSGVYCVISYNENGVVYKRQFFDYAHYWLRTEYYSADDRNYFSAVISPVYRDGVMMLKYKTYDEDGRRLKKEYLFPSLTPPRRKCCALVYANAGMIWYDACFCPAEFAQETENARRGFNFDLDSFTPNIYTTVTDVLDNAPYLTDEDVRDMTPQAQPAAEEPAEDDTKPYSAYDKIENILFEAHKTNKNIFGELAQHSEPSDDKPEAPANELPGEPETKAPEAPEQVAVEEPEETAEEAALEMAEAFGVNPDFNKAEPDEAPADTAHTEEQPSFEHAFEGEPDSIVHTKTGRYRYYGALDGRNRRVGRGRTVSDKGITSYEGGYVADRREGFGICYYKEGSVNYVGNWKDGRRNGAGVGYRLSDGTMHAGCWSNNAPQGFGARFDKDGSFLDVCTYVDGMRSGRSVSFDEDGNIVVRLWSNGELITEKIIAD